MCLAYPSNPKHTIGIFLEEIVIEKIGKKISEKKRTNDDRHIVDTLQILMNT